MKKTYFAALAIVAGLSLMLLSACRMNCVRGSGDSATENRKVADFTKIDISGAYKIILKQDSSLGVTVTADDNLLKYIKTSVSGGKLTISTGKKNVCPRGDLVVTVGVHKLEEIRASGAINITSEGKLVGGDLALHLAGATKTDLDLDVANLSTSGSGVTEMNLKGQASSHELDLSGGGKVHAFDLVTGSYHIETSGASECEINVLRELTVSSSGAASIKYKGNPTTVKNDKSGISSLKKVD